MSSFHFYKIILLLSFLSPYEPSCVLHVSPKAWFGAGLCERTLSFSSASDEKDILNMGVHVHAKLELNNNSFCMHFA